MSEPIVLSYLRYMNDHEASDLYLTVGCKPTFRINDQLKPYGERPLQLEDLHDVINMIFTNRQRRDYEAHMELNTSLDMGPHGRFRVNALWQRHKPALVIRRVISKIPTFDDLRLPDILGQLSLQKRGLILVTGMTGSGKSTTLASMIDYRNQNLEGHIITIEDPVEYYHDHHKSIISQREVGVDTESYAVALKNALRQRPDVILVGEVRDREVMEQALMSAETGHLCLSTLHTTNAYQAIERIINLFPDEQVGQIRLNLSMNLKAIVAQRLLPTVTGGLTPAVEIMINEGLVRECILSGDISKIKDVMEQNSTTGMCTFDQSLIALYQSGLISEETVILNADKPTDIRVKLQQVKLKARDKGSKKGHEALQVMDTSRISLSD